MLQPHADPIVAIATAPGRGAVGIVRVSGRGLASLARAITGRDLAPRVATYGPFSDVDGSPIDHGLALHFPAPHSYTGEDVLELQAHGGPVVLQLLLQRCLQAAAEVDAASGGPRLPRLRLARPGEFTERAFLNGDGPDRRQHRKRRALGQPIAGGRVLAADPCADRRADPPAHADRGNARLS
jgi:tRNA modification GTPase